MRLLIILLTVVVMTVTGCGSTDVNESSTAGSSVEVTTGSSQETQGTTNKETETESQKETQKQTETESQKETQKQTETESQKETQKQTETESQKETQKQTETESQKETQKETETESQKETQKQTEAESQKETQKQTEVESQKETQAQTQIATQAPTQTQNQNTNVGDKITLGTYNGKQIEWTVLAKESGKTLIITTEAIAKKPYNNDLVSVTWETCTLRKWLNNDFYNAAFSASEKDRIADTNVVAENNPEYGTDPGNNTVDKLFLLSFSEFLKYFCPNDNDRCLFWLRSPGGDSYLAMVAESFGAFTYGDGVDFIYAVRPALWINQ